MSDEQIQSEETFHRPRTTPYKDLTGRAWVKRRFEMWEPCTVEHVDAKGVTVVMDDMEEYKVEHHLVKQFDLEPGALVFCRRWHGNVDYMPSFALAERLGEFLGGNPAFVVAAQNEAVELEFPEQLFGPQNRYKHALSDIFFYFDLPPIEWTPTQRVFAYFPRPTDPPIPLLFPGRVHAVDYDAAVTVGFDDQQNSIVPTTLVEPLEINVGDLVYSCMAHRHEMVQWRESWGPCHVVKRVENDLMLQDTLGQVFRATISQIAVLPKNHIMVDRKLERCPGNSAGASGRSALAIKMMNAVHIVRSEHWLDAADDPIAKSDVDALIASDPELAWSTDHWADMLDDGAVTRYYSILWRGEPTFWWYRGDVRCARPSEDELEKMIALAVRLDANVIGPAGEELH